MKIKFFGLLEIRPIYMRNVYRLRLASFTLDP